MKAGKVKILDNTDNGRFSLVNIRTAGNAQRLLQVQGSGHGFIDDISSVLIRDLIEIPALDNLQSRRIDEIVINPYEPQHGKGAFVLYAYRRQPLVTVICSEQIGCQGDVSDSRMTADFSLDRIHPIR